MWPDKKTLDAMDRLILHFGGDSFVAAVDRALRFRMLALKITVTRAVTEDLYLERTPEHDTSG